MAEPRGICVRGNFFPGVTINWARWNRVIVSIVDNYIFWHDSGLDSASMRVLTSATEETWRLNIVIGNLLWFSVNQTYLVTCIHLLVLVCLSLFHLGWSILLFLLNFLQIIAHICKIHLIKTIDSKFLQKLLVRSITHLIDFGFKVLPKVLLDLGFFSELSIFLNCPPACDLLSFLG